MYVVSMFFKNDANLQIGLYLICYEISNTHIKCSITNYVLVFMEQTLHDQNIPVYVNMLVYY